MMWELAELKQGGPVSFRPASKLPHFFSSRFIWSDFMLLLNTDIDSSLKRGDLFHCRFFGPHADVSAFPVNLIAIHFLSLSIDLLEFVAAHPCTLGSNFFKRGRAS